MNDTQSASAGRFAFSNPHSLRNRAKADFWANCGLLEAIGSMTGKTQLRGANRYGSRFMEDKNEETLAFLQNLDARHSQVLDELDALNARIEAVLGTFSQQSPSSSGDSVE